MPISFTWTLQTHPGFSIFFISLYAENDTTPPFYLSDPSHNNPSFYPNSWASCYFLCSKKNVLDFRYGSFLMYIRTVTFIFGQEIEFNNNTQEVEHTCTMLSCKDTELCRNIFLHKSRHFPKKEITLEKLPSCITSCGDAFPSG